MKITDFNKCEKGFKCNNFTHYSNISNTCKLNMSIFKTLKNNYVNGTKLYYLSKSISGQIHDYYDYGGCGFRYRVWDLNFSSIKDTEPFIGFKNIIEEEHYEN